MDANAATSPTGPAGATDAPTLTIALRNGATCELRAGALTIGGTAIPLTRLISAGLTPDMSAPVAPGMPPAPAVALRLADGASYFLTPVEQADAMRLIQAIHNARPDLARPGAGAAGPLPGGAYAPPGFGYGPPLGYAPGPGYPPPYGAPMYPGYPPYATGPAEGDRTLAGICHLSVFFAPIILPLIVWLAMRQSHPYASAQAKQAFWFHLLLGLIAGGLGGALYITFMATLFSTMPTTGDVNPFNSATSFAPFGFLIAFYVVIGALGLFNTIFSIIGAVKAFQGKPFHYPLLGWL